MRDAGREPVAQLRCTKRIGVKKEVSIAAGTNEHLSDAWTSRAGGRAE